MMIQTVQYPSDGRSCRFCARAVWKKRRNGRPNYSIGMCMIYKGFVSEKYGAGCREWEKRDEPR